MHRLAKEAGAQAVLCLQSDECIASMNIDMDSIKEAATDAGVLHLRVSVRDFDRADQADTLPEAVRMLMALLATVNFCDARGDDFTHASTISTGTQGVCALHGWQCVAFSHLATKFV